MINAFRYGAPPHGGSAPGVDRIVMLLADEPNIREVILFPMNQRAEDLMMGAPSSVTPRQLKELGIRMSPTKSLKLSWRWLSVCESSSARRSGRSVDRSRPVTTLPLFASVFTNSYATTAVRRVVKVAHYSVPWPDQLRL